MTKSTRALAASAGLVSALTGLGTAMLVAKLLGGDNPAIALGGRVIDLTPGFLKDWAVRELGTKDKPVLLATIFVAMAVLAAVTGLVALRSRRLGLGLAVLLNLVALAAAVVTTSRTLRISAATIVPGLVALLVGVGLLAVFTAPRVLRRFGEAEKPAGFDRRAFLLLALAGSAVAAASGGVSRLIGRSGAESRAAITLPDAASAATPIPAGTQLQVKGITDHLTPNKDFYRVDTALSVPQVDARAWRLRITGMVEKEIELSFQDLVEMPLVERRITLTCVSNEVGGSYVGNATWLGVRMKDLLALAGPKPGADAVKSTSVDSMTIGTPLSALTDDRDALLAIGMNGEPLPLEHGFPARMVTPGLYGYVSATKWVTELEVTRFKDFSAYWTDRAAGPSRRRSTRRAGSTYPVSSPARRPDASPSPASRGRSSAASPRSRSATTAVRGAPPGWPARTASTPGASGSSSGTRPPGSTCSRSVPRTARATPRLPAGPRRGRMGRPAGTA